MKNGRLASRRIIVVDDEVASLDSEALLLSMQGFENVCTCSDGRDVHALLASAPADLVLLDISMPHLSGIDVLRDIKEHFPAVSVIMLTGMDDARSAVRCMQLGAHDYVVKPIDRERLITTIIKALEHRELMLEAEVLGRCLLDDDLRTPQNFADIVTGDVRMHNVFRYIEAIAPTDLPVLITGETGAGKELIARAIHRCSGRTGSFVCINSAGIDDTFFSDTLFGHAAGAYTGAGKERRGLIERAANGTIFLDEIGDMRPESQVKLLRLLQEKTYYRLGSDCEEVSNARIVAATNRELDKLLNDNSFRKDLFYRLKSHRVHIPPLRERSGDIRLLADAFLGSASAQQHKAKPKVPQEFYTILCNYDFPGNVRELQGIIFDAVSRHVGGVMSCNSIRAAVGLSRDATEAVPEPVNASGSAMVQFPGALPTLEQVELALVEEALRRAGGNKKLAAEMIGMARQTFRNKLSTTSDRR